MGTDYGLYRSLDDGLSGKRETDSTSVQCIYVDTLNRMLIGGYRWPYTGERGGIYYTDDHITWNKVYDSYWTMDIEWIKDINKLFAASDNDHQRTGLFDWILLSSTDRGLTWTRENSFPTIQYNALIDICLNSQGNIYVTTYQELYKSIDNGISSLPMKQSFPSNYNIDGFGRIAIDEFDNIFIAVHDKNSNSEVFFVLFV